MEALELDPEFALASLRLGNWHAARGEDEEAIRYFRRTSEIRPDSPVPYNNVGLALMRMGDKGAALEAFEAGLALFFSLSLSHTSDSRASPCCSSRVARASKNSAKSGGGSWRLPARRHSRPVQKCI